MFSTRPPAAEDFARLSDAILNAAIAGAFSSLSSISARIRRSVALGGFDAGLRLNNAGAGSFDGGAGGGDWAFADSSAARALSAAARSSSSCWAETAPRWERVLERTWRFAVESSSAPALLHYRFAGTHFTLSLIEQGSGGRDRAFRFLDLRGGFKTLLVQYPGIHSRQHLSLGARTDPL